MTESLEEKEYIDSGFNGEGVSSSEVNRWRQQTKGFVRVRLGGEGKGM